MSSFPMNILELTLVFQATGTILAIIFNSIMICIITTTKNHQIGRYKYMIIAFAVYETIYATSVLIFMPSCFVGERTWMLYSVSGPFFNTPLAILSPILYCAFYDSWLLIVMAHFIYRYILLCRVHIAEKISNNFWLKTMLVILLAAGIGYNILCAALWCTSNTVSQGIRDKINEEYGTDMVFNSAYIILRLTKLDGSLSVTGIIASLKHYLLFPGTLSVIIFCSYKIYHRIRELNRTSCINGIHKEVFRALVIQTSIPVFLCYLPSSIYLSFPFLEEGYSLGRFSLFFTVLGTVPKVLDPIITVFCIRQYREAFLGRIWKLRHSAVVGLSGLPNTVTESR